MASKHLPTTVIEMVNELAHKLSSVVTMRDASIASREEQIGRELNLIGQAVMKVMLEAEDPGSPEVVVDGQRYWQALRAEREYLSVFGAVRVNRGIYRAVRNGPTVCPMELRAGIVERFWTPRAAKLAVLAIAEMTSYRASEFFGELGGMRPSRSSLDRLPKALSSRWEANRKNFEVSVREADVIPEDAVAVAVSVDGVMLPTRAGGKHDKKARTRANGRPDKGPAGYREAGCGAISYYDRDGCRLKTVRFGRMPEAKMATLREIVRAELANVRAQRPDLTVVAIADGDPVLWEFLDELQPNESVVDFFHAAEHLKHAIDLTDEPSTVATQRRFQRLRRILKTQRSGVRTIVRSLRQKQPRRTSEAALYRRGIHYFQRHAARMEYPRLQARNLPIGSGVVEGTCRWLVTDRMKRTGMRWDRDGGQAILTFRALLHSGRFTTAWGFLASTYAHTTGAS